MALAAGIGEGGGVFNFQGKATLTNVTIARNTVLNGVGTSPGNPRGGALYDFSGTPGAAATVNLSNSILSIRPLLPAPTQGLSHSRLEIRPRRWIS